MVFFEAPHRTEAALAAMAEALGGDRRGGGLPRADQDPRGGTPRPARRARRLGRPTGVRGEVTIVVAGRDAAPPRSATDPDEPARARSPRRRPPGSSRKEAIVEVARRAGRAQAGRLQPGAPAS